MLLQALIGQKYGYRSFPSVIKCDIFETLRKMLVDHGQDVQQLDTWFKKDSNALPAVYILQPISSILKHFKDKVTCCHIAVLHAFIEWLAANKFMYFFTLY